MEIAIESTNTRGRYQSFIWVQIFLLPFTTLIITAGYAFLTKPPSLYCKPKLSSSSYSPCEYSLYCSHKEDFDIILDKEHSISNFAFYYDLYCERGIYSSMLSSAYFTGCIVGVFIWGALPDIYGRYPVYKWLLYLNVFSQINYLFCFNIYHLIFTSFLSGTSTYVLNMQNFLVIEFFDRNIASIAMSVMNASYGLVGITLGLYFLTINSLKLFLYLNFAFVLICLYLTLNFMVESPRWLNAKNRVQEAIEALKTMALINNSIDTFNLFLEENKELLRETKETVKKIDKNYTLIEIFKLKSQRKTLLGVMYVFFIIAICFYGIFITLNQSNDNFYINSFLVFIGEMIAELGSGYLVNIYGRVTITVISCHMGGIAFILSYLLQKGTIRTLLLFISSFGVAAALNIMYIYTNEVFPLSIRALTFGFLYLVSRFGGVFVPFFISNQYYPLVLGGMTMSCGFVFSYMKETLGETLEDDVPEAIREYTFLSSFKARSGIIDKVKMFSFYGSSFASSKRKGELLSNSMRLNINDMNEYFKIDPSTRTEMKYV